MSTRTVTGTLVPVAGATSAQSLSFRLDSFPATNGLVTALWTSYSVTTGSDGAFSVDLQVPDDGSWRYICTLPDGQNFRFTLGPGSATTLEAILLSQVGDSTIDPDAVDALLASYQNTAERGQADGYASLDADGLLPEAQLPSTVAITVAMAASNSAADNTALLTAAIAAGARRILLPAGEFPINNITLTVDGVSIRGAGMPYPNDARTALVGGTILKGGALYLDYHTNITVADIGFDSTVTGTYAVFSGDSGTGQQNVLLENVCALGRGFATSHAFYFTAGNNIMLSNCRAYKFDHGIALRTSYGQVVNYYAEDCALTSITCKGIHEYDGLYHTLSNLIVVGTSTGSAGPLVVEGHDGRAAGNVSIANVAMVNVSRGFLIKSADNATGDGYGSVANVVISNATINGCQYDAVLCQNPNISHILCSGINARGVGASQPAFSNTSASTTVRLVNCWTDASVLLNGYFQRAQINGRELSGDAMTQADNLNRMDSIVHSIKNSLTAVYRLLDTFTTDRAAGAVHGTAAEPGPGTRYIVDSGSKLSLSGGAVVWASGVGDGDPTLSWSTPLTRIPGRILRVNLTLTTNRVYVGWWATLGTLSTRKCVIDYLVGNVRIVPQQSVTAINSETFGAGTYTLTVILRRQGAVYLVKGGSFTNNQILYIDSVDSTETLYPMIATIGTTTNVSIADASVLDDEWLPTPLASDGFSAAGTTDGLGHREGIEATAGSGGSGLAWTAQVGTWTITSGRALASALSGGVAFYTVPAGVANVVARCKLWRSAGSVGMVLRWTDASNHVLAYYDGTNFKLDQVVAGVVTNRISSTTTYADGNELMIVFAATATARLYYNNIYIGVTTSINAGLTGTACGLYTTSTANAIDDFVVIARGTGTEHAALDSI